MEWDDELVAAYADGELHSLIQDRFEEALQRDDALRARVEREKMLRARLGGHFDPVLDEPVPDALRGMLAPRPAADVVSLDAHRRRPDRAWVPTAIAASLVVGLFGGQYLASGGGISTLPAAGGDLAQALDTQLASAPATAGATRIGTTFRDGEGRLCRTFDGADVAGFACRDGRAWRIEMLAPGSGAQASGYQQASSGAMLALQAAQERMAGEPLGEEEERRVRDAGWR
ncbi:anti-sigma factor [Sphingosinicella sp. YJ22]|uniref:anti-sigma factor family protein n=1 Tax=Sphingosinicella sp. YJ22 TaxID=1104780 RepID=UPI001407C9EA|nr:anti-sigma factor [Sphingosinicella sp. YJ22]